MKILFEIGKICRDYIAVYLVIWYIYSSDRTKTLLESSRFMTRTLCLRTAKCIFKYSFDKKGDAFGFIPSFC